MIRIIEKLREILEYHHLLKIRRNVAMFLAVVIIFVTTYSLTLSAVSLERKTAEFMPGVVMGKDADTAARLTLHCPLKVHEHTEDCYEDRPVYDDSGQKTGEEKVLICGQADYAVHHHDDNCYKTIMVYVSNDGTTRVIADESEAAEEIARGEGKIETEKVLVCTLEEIEAHEHTDECYEEQRVLICGREETDGHKHSDDCYSVTRKLTCEKEEHEHSDACYEDVVVDTQKELICGYEEGEVISEAEYSDPVYSDPVIDEETGEVTQEAQLVEEAHVIKEAEVHHHTDDCYETKEITERKLTCEQEEHTHSDDCYTEKKELTCGLKEGEGHKHSDKCYETRKVAVCGKLELHTHTMDCYEKGPEGESPEEMGWAHYEENEFGEKVVAGEAEHLICGKLQLIEHQHTDACFEDSDISENASSEQMTEDLSEDPDAADNAKKEEKADTADNAEVSDDLGSDKAAEEAAEADPADQQQAEEDPSQASEENDRNEDLESAAAAAFIRDVNVSGADYTLTIECDENSGIPVDASITASALKPEDADYASYYERASEAAAEQSDGGTEQVVLGLFDLTIADEYGIKIQPASPVTVTVNFDSGLVGPGRKVYAVHFPGTGADGTTSVKGVMRAAAKKLSAAQIVNKIAAGEEGSDVEVIDTTVSGSSVSFETDGFSVYSIVDAPEPIVQNLTELKENPNEPFLLSYGNTIYFTNTMNGKGCFKETNNVSEAAEWYFENIVGSDDQYYIYTKVGGQKKYIQQDGTGNNVKLSETGTAFTLSSAAAGLFYLKHSEKDLWLQHSNGGGGIRFYTDNKNPANSRIRLTYAASETMPEYYGLDGTTRGIVYDAGSIFCTALMTDSSNPESTAAQDMVILELHGNPECLYVPQDSDITEWTFHWAGAGNYYITTKVDGTEYYLTIVNGAASLSESRDTEGTLIRVSAGTGANSGFYSFSSGDAVLAISGDEGSRVFSGTTDETQKHWMKLADKSMLTDDDYLVYSAKKIRVSDKNAKKVILYTRVWNGSRYDFYAVDYDGSLIRCKDDGDVIHWVGDQYETAVWEVSDHTSADGQQTGYYELKNLKSGLYLNPQLSSEDPLFSGSESWINLDGRYYQEDYTTIKAWDTTYYSYIGMRADVESGKVVPCPSALAGDFYFAEVEPTVPHLTTVETINNNDFGISMRMIDFNELVKVGNDERAKLQVDYFATKNEPGLVSTDIKGDGYPVSNHNNQSLAGLFAGDTEVNKLFIQSVYDESGYFEYDSTKNFAYLKDNGNFEVYDQLGTIERADTVTMYHGQFMPYNSLINPQTNEPWPYSEMYTNTRTVEAKPLPTTDPRYGEGLHEIPKSEADYFFGMEMEASFTQTQDGLDAWGHDIIFEFSGDDDFWLYVDGELVLDLGGIHQAMTGSVNFRTGEIIGRNGVKTTLRQVFAKNYKERNPSAATEEINDYLSKYFEGDGTVFKDFSTHRMKVFYMERGAGASNLHMRFNLTAVKPGEVTLKKKVTGSDNIDYDLMEFPYQILYYTKNDSPYDEEHKWHTLKQDKENPAVTYQGSSRPVKFAETYTPVGETYTPVGETKVYPDVFFLKPNEIASIDMPADVVEYKIVECSVNMNIFKSVSANGDVLSKETDKGRHDYETKPASVEERPEVDYVNEVDPDSLRTLTISKILWDENGFQVVDEGTDHEHKEGKQLIGYDDDKTTFAFRLNMSSADSETLTPVNRKEYYVRDPERHYCKWDPSLQRFQSLGYVDYPEFAAYIASRPEEERSSYVFETSLGGGFNMIPAGYSVEFRGLPVDSSFEVLERDSEIPEGYKRIEYERDKGSYISPEDVPNRGTIRANEDPHIIVHNKRGWGLTVKKVWSDQDYMEKHDDIYFAVYVKDQLLDGSVRKLTAPATSLYYYFDELLEGASFDNYRVYEVKLTDPTTDEEGVINYRIEKIDEGGTLITGGTTMDGQHLDDLHYEVSYTIGEATGGSDNKNVREDIVNNTRRGIKLIKKDWEGNALPGADFTLKDSDGNPVGTGTYTSGEDGLITIAYLDPGTYTLEEIKPPYGFEKPSVWTITKGTDNSIRVTGDTGTYEVTPETAESMAVITFKNKGFSLRAVKVEEKSEGDSTDDKVLQGAVFALYKQVQTVSGLVRDHYPMTGFDSLTSDEDGIIPKITSSLPPGTYYLSEVSPPSGYKKLAGDLVFTISPEGHVVIPDSVSTADPKTLVILNNLEEYDVEEWITHTISDGHTSYTIRIPDEPAGVPVRIVKTDQSGNLLENAVFTLTGEGIPEAVTCTSVKTAVTYGDITIEEALLYENAALALGEYELTEIAAPGGYNTLEGKVQITVENSGTGLIVTAKVNGQESAFARAERIDVDHPEYGWRVTIMNTSGSVLPHTGGPGTRIFTIAGLIMTAGAGLLLWRRRRLI